MRHLDLAGLCIAASVMALLPPSARAGLIDDATMISIILEQDGELRSKRDPMDLAGGKSLIYLDGAGWADRASYDRAFSEFAKTTKYADEIARAIKENDGREAIDGKTIVLRPTQEDTLDFYWKSGESSDFKLLDAEQMEKIFGDTFREPTKDPINYETIQRWLETKPLEGYTVSRTLRSLDAQMYDEVADTSTDSNGGDAAVVPEPAALSLLALGLSGIIGIAARRRRRGRVSPGR